MRLQGSPDAGVTALYVVSSELLQLQCGFTSTETIRTIREWERRTATSTFTQLFGSVQSYQIVSLLKHGVHHNQKTEFCVFSHLPESPQRPFGLLGNGNTGRPLRLLHSSLALSRAIKLSLLKHGVHHNQKIEFCVFSHLPEMIKQQQQ